MPSAVGAHEFTARPGHHLPPLDADSSLFDRLGPGFSLLMADSGSDRVAGFVSAASEWGIPLQQVVVEGNMARYDTQMVLVRPDHFVSWVDDGTGFDAAAVLARATGH